MGVSDGARHIKQEKRASECRCWPPELLTYVVICVITPPQILIFLSESGCCVQVHLSNRWLRAQNCNNQGLEFSSALRSSNWWNNSIRYLRFKLLMGKLWERKGESKEERTACSWGQGSFDNMCNMLLHPRVYSKNLFIILYKATVVRFMSEKRVIVPGRLQIQLFSFKNLPELVKLLMKTKHQALLLKYKSEIFEYFHPLLLYLYSTANQRLYLFDIFSCWVQIHFDNTKCDQ